MKEHHLTFTTSEITESFRSFMAGNNPVDVPDYKVASMRSPKVDEWVGDSGPGILEKLNHGYWPKDSAPLAVGSATIEIPGLEFAEDEGELQVDLALSGDDMPYVQWAPMPAKRGVVINAELCALAGVDNKILTAYSDWLMRVIISLQQCGITPTVNLLYHTQSPFTIGECVLHVTVPMMRAGYAFDPMAWRAFFTPGGYRILGFYVRYMAAKALGKTCDSGMGKSIGRAYSAVWNHTGEILDIGCHGSARDFPEARMSAAVAKRPV